MVDGEIQPDVVYEDEDILAFRDAHPQSPTHVLLIPKEHIATTNDLDDRNVDIVGRLYLAAKQVAADEGIAERGYRMVMNCNPEAGQSVYHLHLHLLGGRPMNWPPG
jgi:histidine triad (HIT) family protein